MEMRHCLRTKPALRNKKTCIKVAIKRHTIAVNKAYKSKCIKTLCFVLFLHLYEM